MSQFDHSAVGDLLLKAIQITFYLTSTSPRAYTLFLELPGRLFVFVVSGGLLRERLLATLSGFFGVLAAVLAMVGLYGVISYLVVKRRNEIGLRMALGANRVDILAMILREAATLLGTGLAIGAALAFSAGNIAASMLYGLKPRDPLILAVAVTTMAVIALVASLLPAQRAASVDPMSALREE